MKKEKSWVKGFTGPRWWSRRCYDDQQRNGEHVGRDALRFIEEQVEHQQRKRAASQDQLRFK
jgi:hypothetical protein